MTTQELNRLVPGTYVKYEANSCTLTGVVTVRPDLNNDVPHYVIDWADGEQTDGRDVSALTYVEVLT